MVNGFNELELSKLGIQGGQAAFDQAAKAKNDQANERLRMLLQGQAADAKDKRDLAGLKSLMDSGLVNDGGAAKVGEYSVGRGIDPNKGAQQGVAQARAYAKAIDTEYKPINDQLDSSKATLDLLNQGNANADKLALINEARIAAGMGGSRALKGIMDALSGGKTSNSSFQDTMNFIQNTPNIPTMQPAQRDAIRETVFGRVPQLAQMHSDASARMLSRGPQVAPNTDWQGIANTGINPAQSKLSALQKMQQDYQTQRQAMQQGGNNAISAPATANENPSNLQKAGNFIANLFSKAAPAAPANPAPSTRVQPTPGKQVKKALQDPASGKITFSYSDGSSDNGI